MAASLRRAVGVLLGGQIEDLVGGIEVGLTFTAAAVGHAADLDLPEDGRQRPLMTPLDTAVADALGIHHLHPRLPLGAQVEMVLEELADQRPALDVEQLLQLTVGEGGGLLAVHDPQYPLECGVAAGEGRAAGGGQGDDHDRRSLGASALVSSASPWSALAPRRAFSAW